MIQFTRANLAQKESYNALLFESSPRGCEYSFANLYLWGRQQIAFINGCAAMFSHFNGNSIYPYPIGPGDRRTVLEAIIHDSRMRGIPCRLSGLTTQDCQELESWFPGRFHIRNQRNSFDYCYAIDDLADLRGRKFQKKRNHVNRFRADHPDCQVVTLNPCNLGMVQQMVEDWYRLGIQKDPEGDYLLESLAIARAFQNYSGLGMEGIALVDDGVVLAMTMGSRMSHDTFDIHFEKAREDADGAYAAINCEFARYLRQKYPDIAYLDREEDLGLEGLRKAKLSYNPHHLVEKHWAYLVEDLADD